MKYRYFECKCGNSFHGFIEFHTDSTTHTCDQCGEEAEMCLNDPEATGTKLLFNYMER
jgi:hypothetical protein